MPFTLELEIVREIIKSLTKKGINFQTEPSISGLRPDFVLQSPDGRRIILEVKNWEASPANLRRASEQAKMFQKNTEADDAFVLIPSLKKSDPSKKLLAQVDYLDILAQKLESKLKIKRRVPKISARVRKSKRSYVFAAMPFKVDYDDVFFVAMSGAVDSLDVDCVRVDYNAFTGDIPGRIKQLIRESIAVIADVSEARPNVLYEMGFGEASKRPIVQICSTGAESIPFDVRNDNTIFYNKGQTHKLKGQISQRLKVLLKK